jgi:hypothetical protein
MNCLPCRQFEFYLTIGACGAETSTFFIAAFSGKAISAL